MKSWRNPFISMIDLAVFVLALVCCFGDKYWR